MFFEFDSGKIQNNSLVNIVSIYDSVIDTDFYNCDVLW